MKTHFALLVAVSWVSVASAATTVSRPVQAGVSAAGSSFNPVFSADGRHLVFVSHANNLVTNDDVRLSLDVFVHDLASSNTVLVSVNSSGTGGANDDANYPSISSNGQFIAFASRASNLVPGDTNGTSDIFLRDILAGTTRLVSVDTNGGSQFGGAEYPLISADGRWVFFESSAPNLTTNSVPAGRVNIYARDLSSNSTVLVALAPSGSGDPGKCELSGITPDGRFIAFFTSGFGFGDQEPTNIFVHDLQLGQTTLVSTNVATLVGTNINYRCSGAVLSAEGRYVAFIVTPLSGSVAPLVMRHDLQSGSTLVVTPAATNTANGVQISADGRFVLFEEMNGSAANVRLWDAQAGITNVMGCAMGGDTRNPSMTSDAGRVAFLACSNIYVWDRLSGSTFLVTSGSETNGPLHADSPFINPAISADGISIAFHTISADLVEGDLNGASDIYVSNVSAETTRLISKAAVSRPASTSQAHSTLGLNSVSGDGRFVVTLRYDDPSAFRDTNGWLDVYVSDLWSNTTVAVSINSVVWVTNDFGGGAPVVSFIDNTNSFVTPIISGDGTTVFAVRNVHLGSAARVVGTSSLDGKFGSAGLLLETSAPAGGFNRMTYAPSVSANGQLLVFTTTDFQNADVVLRQQVLLTNGLATSTNHLISQSMSGGAGSGTSSNGLLSQDGRWVVFESTAGNLVTNIVGGGLALYARDWQSNATHLVSVSPAGNSQWGYVAGSAVISGNSRYVAFSSGNNYLTVHDLLTHASVIADDPAARFPSLNYDGRYVAYVKRPTNSNFDQIFLRDLQGTESSLVSVTPAGSTGNGVSANAVVNGDGRYVVFQSRAANLVAGDINNANDVFVRDRLLGVTMLVSANAQGLPGNGASSRPVMAADGRTVVFQSFASDLVTGDYNDKRDVFVLKLGSADTDGDGMDDDWEVVYFGNLSRNGSGDFDGDGASDLQEFLAGTDPTNSGSVFRLLTVTPIGGGGTLVMWTGSPSRTYRVEFKDDLAATNWTSVNGTIFWNGTTASMADTTATNSAYRFYRAVRLP